MLIGLAMTIEGGPPGTTATKRSQLGERGTHSKQIDKLLK